MNRRHFLWTLSSGAGLLGGLGLRPGSVLAFALNGSVRGGPAAARAQSQASPSVVSLIRGRGRRPIIYDALKPFEDEIFAAIGDKQVLVKPNMAVSRNPLAVTHPDAVRGVLEFLRPRHKRTILIGESGVLNTRDGYRNNGYAPLEREYDARLLDLNEGTWRPWYVFGKAQNPQPVRIIDTFLDPRVYLISLAPMKTHDCVLVTLSLKNALMAAPLNDYRRSDKGYLHGPEPAADDILHFNLFHLAHEVYPDLAVIDGFEAMEGDGPAWGTPVETRLALASPDALAADVTATRIMGFDPKTVLYLSAMAEAGLGQGDPSRIRVTGAPIDQCLFKFKANKRLIEPYKLS